MTIDMDAVTETIDALQLSEKYDEIREIIQYAVSAIINDEQPLDIIPPMF